MLKTLGAQVKEFKKASIATPIFMILEVKLLYKFMICISTTSHKSRLTLLANSTSLKLI